MGGWVAGLALMMEDSGRGMACHAPTNHETIFNYFASEIFNKTDKPTQDFLLKTAFLPDMTAEMAQRLMGASHADTILSGLNRNNFFCQRQAAHNPIYRYHPLFRTFLQNHAQNSFTQEELNQIRQSAATILAESGQTEEAARLLQDAKDFEALVKLILTHAQYLIMKGRSKTLEAWITVIPADILNSAPWLLYWLGICLLPFDLKKSRLHSERAFELFRIREDVSGIFLSWSLIVEALLHWTGFEALTGFTITMKWHGILF